MRLTLRTLLAWLDAVLPAEEQHALGDKVAASQVAPQLIARIRDAVEQPALGAPRPEGRGLADDANSVAEYLDNTLPADRLETFERICIESDVHLAEVAACHGMLAECARDPLAAGPVDAVVRQRLLAVIRHGVEAGATGVGRDADAESRNPAGHPVGGWAAGDGRLVRSAATAGPRRRAPLAAWLLALAAVLLVAVLGFFLVWSLGRDRGGRRIAGPATRALAEAAAVEATPAEAARTTAQAEVDASRELPAEPPPAVVAAPAPPPAEVDQEPRMDSENADAAAVSAAVEVAPPVPVGPASDPPRVPQGDALAIAAPATPPKPPAGAASEPVVAEPNADQPPAEAASGFVSGASLLLHKAAPPPAAGLSGWAALAQHRPLAPREDLVAPPFCRPEVSVGGVTVRLEPNTRATLTQDAGGGPRLEVVFGRAVVRSSVAEPRLGITAGGLSGVVTEGLQAPLGVEVVLDRAAGVDPATGPVRVRAMVATTNSGIVWLQSQADGQPSIQPLQGIPARATVEKESRLGWDSIDPAGVTVQARRGLPEWLAGPPRPDRLEQAAAEALAAKATTDPVERGLRELADDKRAENRVAAVATLALLGDYDELVTLLAAETPFRKLEDRQWARLFEMTVPLALARGANAATRLGQALEARGPAGKGADLLAVARGFDDAALAAGADARLVAALDAPELVVRRFAIRTLLDSVQPAEADRARYRPDRSQELRRESVAWWRKQLADGRIRRSPAAPVP